MVRRINRTTSDSSSSPLPPSDNGVYAVTLSDGTIARFRDVLLEDILDIRRSGVTDEVETTARITARACIGWGEKPGITPIQLDKIPYRDLKTIIGAIGSDVNVEEIARQHFSELPDYSIEVTLFDGAIARFRDITVADIKQARKESTDLIEQLAILASLTCMQWGDRDNITYDDLLKIKALDFRLLAQALQRFLG